MGRSATLRQLPVVTLLCRASMATTEPGRNDGIKRVVLKPDVSAKTPFRIEALQNLDRNLRVGPKHSG